MFKRGTFLLFTFFAMIAGSTEQASAELLTITSLPVNSSGPLPHTSFHSANLGDGTGGDILGWANLSRDDVSTYDPEMGDLDLHLRIYLSSEDAFANDLDPNIPRSQSGTHTESAVVWTDPSSINSTAM